jgi:hypothetical protein
METFWICATLVFCAYVISFNIHWAATIVKKAIEELYQ